MAENGVPVLGPFVMNANQQSFKNGMPHSKFQTPPVIKHNEMHNESVRRNTVFMHQKTKF